MKKLLKIEISKTLLLFINLDFILNLICNRDNLIDFYIYYKIYLFFK